MRLVIDTNILISALLASTSLPARLVVHWRAGRFDLLTTSVQLGELMRVTRYPKHLLGIAAYQGTKIATVRDFLTRHTAP